MCIERASGLLDAHLSLTSEERWQFLGDEASAGDGL
jgi:hypothetical protein